MIHHDPIEDTPEYKAIEAELDEKIFARIGKPKGMGYCHRYWSVKKEILKKDYGIEWSSPANLNPHVYFD